VRRDQVHGLSAPIDSALRIDSVRAGAPLTGSYLAAVGFGQAESLLDRELVKLVDHGVGRSRSSVESDSLSVRSDHVSGTASRRRQCSMTGS